VAPVLADDPDSLMRIAAFEQVRRLSETHDHLTAHDLKPGFIFDGKRVPLVNPQRGIFKPQRMLYLLSIRTVFPKPGARGRSGYRVKSNRPCLNRFDPATNRECG
jgi:putative restriction endonuclease